MPVEHYFAAESAEPQRKGGHRVGMMDVYYVVVAADSSELEDQGGGYHSGCHLAPGLDAYATAVGIEMYDAAIRHIGRKAAAEHIAV